MHSIVFDNNALFYLIDTKLHLSIIHGSDELKISRRNGGVKVLYCKIIIELLLKLLKYYCIIENSTTVEEKGEKDGVWGSLPEKHLLNCPANCVILVVGGVTTPHFPKFTPLYT